MQKIMFDNRFDLTRAVLDGIKTMTRRLVPPIPPVMKIAGDGALEFYLATQLEVRNGVLFTYHDGCEGWRIAPAQCQPRYKIGEVVAVAQSYLSIHEEMMDDSFGEGYCDAIYDSFRWATVYNKPGWENKMFVRADLMPHQIRITDIRVERIQDISDEDCMKEGVEKGYIGYYINGLKTKDWEKESHVEKDGNTYKLFPTPREAFAALINKISGKGTWESNPWEFVYEFELVK